MDMADAIEDKMTLEEMLKVPHAFYGEQAVCGAGSRLPREDSRQPTIS